MKPANRICKNCGKSREKGETGSLTQFINLCACNIVVENQESQGTVQICRDCGKKVGEGRKGSFTQFIFQSHFCSCNRPVLDGAFEFTPLSSPAFVAEDDACESELDLDPDLFPMDRYKPIRRLGKGASAEVYLASDRLLKKRVTVKLLHAHDRALLIAFQEEGKAISRLKDPNIIGILDFGVTKSSVPYMVLDFFDGITFRDYLDQSGIVDIEMCWIIFSQVCGGLAYAHEQGIYHRDIKPENILIAGFGTDDILVKIIDFGVAKVSEDSDRELNNQSYTVAGTPGYMSADQLLGYNYDARSEVYSVGCVLFEALSGKPPFKADTSLETLSLHAHAEIPSLNAVQSKKHYSQDIEEIVQKSLAKNPAERFQSMDELVSAIEKLFFTEGAHLHVKPLRESRIISEYTIPLILLFGLVCIVLPLFLMSMMRRDELKSDSYAFQYKEKEIRLEERKPAKMTSNLEPRSAGVGEDLLTPRLLPSGRLPQRYFAAGDWSDEDLKLIGSYRKIRGLSLGGKQITGSGLKYIVSIPLDGIDLGNTPVQDKYLAVLSEIKSLKKLKLNDTATTDLALYSISKLPNLTYLNLKNTMVSDASTASIGKFKKLAVLDLRQLKGFKGQKLSELSSCTNLFWLVLNDTKIGADGAMQLSKLKHLKHLSVENCGIVDDSLLSLSLMNLETIDLSRNELTYKGIEQLRSMKSLKRLLVADCPAISSQDIKRFAEIRPDCVVVTKIDPRLKWMYDY